MSLSVLLLCLLTWSVQAQLGAPTDQSQQFEAMMADPSSVPQDEMAALYLEYLEPMVHRNPDTAFVLYAEMVDFGKKIGNDDVIANGYASIAFMHKLMGDVDAQIQYNRKVLDFRHDSILFALAMTDIGMAYLTKTEFDSAHYYIDSAFTIGSQIDSMWRSTFYFHKCYLLLREDKHYAALDILLECIPFIPESNTIRRMELFSRIGHIYRTLGDFNKAIEYEKKSIQIAEINDIPSELAKAKVRLGELLLIERE